MTPEASTSNYAQIVSEFKSMLEIDKRGKVKDFLPKEDWEMGKDYLTQMKVSAKSEKEGLFLKMFPEDESYAGTAYQVFQELGQLTDMQHPVLLPLALEGEVLVFPYGEVVASLEYEKYVEKGTKEKIEQVVTRNGLSVLGPLEEILVVRVNGVDYFADPFDDTEFAINEFAERKRGN